jgi:hypothetical protein
MLPKKLNQPKNSSKIFSAKNKEDLDDLLPLI